MKKHLKKIIIFVLLNLLIISQTSCVGKDLTSVSKTTYAFDTLCEVTIYGMEEDEAYSIIDSLFSKFNYYESIFSNKVEDSELSRLNRGENFIPSDDLMELLRKGLYYSEKTDGIFDITIGSVTRLWNFHNDNYIGVVPNEDDIKEALKHVGYDKIEIDTSVKIKDTEMVLDLGGIAKGYIADRACEYLKEKGVTSAVVNLGGNVETVGGKGDNPFNIGVINPLSNDGSLLGYVPGTDLTVVTSGTYQRYFMASDGKTYHHILDTKTGYPVESDIIQVTLISQAGYSVDCDALSTTVLSMGVEKGLEFIKSFDFCEAIILDKDGNVYYSSGNSSFKEY